MKLVIIIPVKCDLRVIQRAKNIVEGILCDSFEKGSLQIDLFVIDDGFNPFIQTNLNSLNVNYIFGKTKGKGSAVIYGLKNIDSDHYLILDSDDSVEISSIQQLIKIIQGVNHADLIYGVRIYKNVDYYRRLIGLVQLLLANTLILKNFIQDTQCPLKYLSGRLRDVLIRTPWISGGMYDILFFFITDLNKLSRSSIIVNWDDQQSILKIHKIIFGDLISIFVYKFRYSLHNIFCQKN